MRRSFTTGRLFHSFGPAAAKQMKTPAPPVSIVAVGEPVITTHYKFVVSLMWSSPESSSLMTFAYLLTYLLDHVSGGVMTSW